MFGIFTQQSGAGRVGLEEVQVLIYCPYLAMNWGTEAPKGR